MRRGPRSAIKRHMQPWLMIWLIWYCLLVSAAEALQNPRVALLYVSRGSMPLETVWREFLGSIGSMELPALNQQQWDEAMEVERTADVRKRVKEAGSMVPNDIVQDADCVSNAIIKVRLSPIGAQLKDPTATPHPVYASQTLFSIYVHNPPGSASIPEDSIFHGREITPSMHAERYTHSLGVLSLLLLEAAMYDEAVSNARFVLISESDIPLYNAGALYLQLMLSHKSRVGPSYSFEELLHVDPESSTVSPYMFVAPFTKDHFSKTTQWVSLTRAAATAAVHDRVVESWFATFGGSRWRCAFLSEARTLLPEASRLYGRGVQIPDRNAALQLKRHRALPANFSQGELLEGILPGTPSAPPARGVGRRSGGWTLPRWGGGGPHERPPDVDITPVQRDAVVAYRREMRLRPPSWAYLPFDTPREELVAAGAGAEDSEEAIAAREQIWNSLLGTSGATRDLRGVGEGGQGRGLLQGDLLRMSREDRDEDSKEEQRRQDILQLHDNHSQYVNGRLSQVSGVVAASEASPSHSRPLIEVLLHASAALANSSDPNARPYSLPWPLPSCSGSDCGNTSRPTAVLATIPWEQWTEGEQMDVLLKLFPGSASRVVNVVSDECMIKSQLNFYGLTGPEWQTEGFSTYVDWSRADNAGHPGSFSRPMLREDPVFICRLIRSQHCDSQANSTYVSAGELFREAQQAAAVQQGIDGGGENAGATSDAAVRRAWPHTTLQDSCVLFARKFKAGAAKEVDGFFSPCGMLGFNTSCLRI